MTPEQFAAKMGRRRRALQSAVVASEAASLAAGLKKAVALSSIRLTGRDLQKASYPFARRQPAVFRIVKDQRLDYRQGWKAEGPEMADGALVSRLYNDSKVPEFLLSGKRAVTRDQRPEILLAVRRARKPRLAAAVAQVLKQA